MKNKIVGYMIIGISLIIGFITYSFNKALSEIVNTNCSHGSDCVMWESINFQTNTSLILMIAVILVGAYLVFFTEDKKKPRNKIKYSELRKKLSEDENLVLSKIVESDGTIFQSELVEKTDFNKVKITRILDSLEGKGVITRKRRGMTNVVILNSKYD
jgi:uncharacterized membrane protein|tara:strand:+ start:1717 stop:2190 length:474 start_codon:yes stop_codon:yes gene_type:complete